MSDLTATNCGCNDTCGRSGNNHNNCGFGGNSCIWIILLLFLCNGNGCDNGCGCGSFGMMGGGNNCCSILIWILLISCFCGNGFGCNSCCD